jgi:CubicO group peptidase (beta-lactamase class C family)
MTRRTVILSSFTAALASALEKEDWNRAASLVEAQTSTGAVTAASLHVQQGKSELKRSFGQARTPDAPFLLASITKPMTATAVMLLSDRKQLSISDPVQKYMPEFTGGERDRMTIKHLLTHTSGLPDMLPENDELRKKHAPLKEFVAGACKTPLKFSPGTKVQYQSMGILLAAEIVERVTRRRLSDLLRDELFQPLGMKHTTLGLGGRPLSWMMPSQVTADPEWNWNSQYWRDLASPWGGAHATASDVSLFLRSFTAAKQRVLKPETAALMITNQNAGLNRPYGIGWAMDGAKFGSGCSAKTFGHGGSTGTLCWLDPEKDLSFVLLTTKPAEFSQATLLKPASDAVSVTVTTNASTRSL